MLFPEDRMNVHKNARLTPIGRERLVRLVESGQTPKAVSEAAGVCPRTVRQPGCDGEAFEDAPPIHARRQ